ncbi:hypothetical protein PVAND_004849 [Polypedilum vanderplanki]|uniref:Uncharacterized protein n=1 Tax=Polypedilum vanderplanki TaxID=319348 RepID=A0A9J6BYZ3_POLVA|nr:hypothetical protein PVAND_004849 [Polypedilum vanderplanki]
MENFNPQVYNFTLSREFADAVLNLDLNCYEVNCPSYQVLLDHTLAVIFHCFNDEGNELLNLNKSDILWALKFLEAIDTKECEANDTKDLDALITFMKKLLISRYSIENEKEVSIVNQTFHDSIKHDTTSSFALDEFFENPDVYADKGKPLLDDEQKENEDIEEPSACTTAEVIKYLKKLKNNSTDGELSINDVIDKLEQ